VYIPPAAIEATIEFVERQLASPASEAASRLAAVSPPA
jgi:hypothetical protein